MTYNNTSQKIQKSHISLTILFFLVFSFLIFFVFLSPLFVFFFGFLYFKSLFFKQTLSSFLIPGKEVSEP